MTERKTTKREIEMSSRLQNNMRQLVVNSDPFRIGTKKTYSGEGAGWKSRRAPCFPLAEDVNRILMFSM